jgi:hypothetical protein
MIGIIVLAGIACVLYWTLLFSFRGILHAFVSPLFRSRAAWPLIAFGGSTSTDPSKAICAFCAAILLTKSCFCCFVQSHRQLSVKTPLLSDPSPL